MYAIIGGSGLQSLQGFTLHNALQVDTPWGKPSAPPLLGTFAGRNVLFLARHGIGHTIPPHRINYRANVDALKRTGATQIVAVAAVGGISAAMRPGTLAVPSQIVDYSHGRDQSFFDGHDGVVDHIDFTEPYDAALRARLLAAACSAGVPLHDGGVYGATQGPRLETAAEIDRLARDGCDLVGMTGMPEAALAREAALRYACLAVIANRAAGRGESVITMQDIERNIAAGLAQVHAVLAALLSLP